MIREAGVDAPLFVGPAIALECKLINNKEYGVKVPFLVRVQGTPARCENGKANKLNQSLYNRLKANLTQLLAMKMNGVSIVAYGDVIIAMMQRIPSVLAVNV